MADKPTTAWAEDAPAGTIAASLIDDYITQMKTQLREVIGADHKMDSSGQGATWGYHNQVTLIEAADIGTGASGLPILGAQTCINNGTAKPELCYTDEDDDTVQITRDGVLAVPAGFIRLWGGSIANCPSGYLVCYGQAISRTTYLDLYTAIGTTNGVGDGSTTFNVPDFADKFVVGCKTGGTYSPSDTSTTATHAHTGPSHTHTVSDNTGIPSATATLGTGEGAIPSTTHYHSFSATTGSGGTGATGSGSSVPPYYASVYVIKT